MVLTNMVQGRIQDFHWGGGGGAQKIMCPHAHYERETGTHFRQGVQGPALGLWKLY